MNELKAKDKEIDKLRSEVSQLKTGDIMSGAVDLGGVTLVAVTVEGVEPAELRAMSDKVKEDPDAVAVICGVNGQSANFACGCGKNAVARGIKAGDLIKNITKLCGGSGGGKPDSAMGGGKDVLKLDDALATVDDFVAEKLK